MKKNNEIKQLTINPQKETKKITGFLQETLKKTGLNHVVLGLSGGIDSMTSLYLLKESLDLKNIIIAHLYYEKKYSSELQKISAEIGIPHKNIHLISIKKQVDSISELMKTNGDNKLQHIRVGNIAARVRMIALYDLAKTYNALVCGTENKSEYLLGYFTRFGDQASDIEPIQHLYKTQVYNLAEYLKVPEPILKRTPSADLWVGQTDENEFGFSYEEADLVLYNHFDNDISVKKLETHGLKNSQKIIDRSLANHFKHITPYYLK